MWFSEFIFFILSCFLPSIRRDLELQSNIEKQNDFLENEEDIMMREYMELINKISRQN